MPRWVDQSLLLVLVETRFLSVALDCPHPEPRPLGGWIRRTGASRSAWEWGVNEKNLLVIAWSLQTTAYKLT